MGVPVNEMGHNLGTWENVCFLDVLWIRATAGGGPAFEGRWVRGRIVSIIKLGGTRVGCV